MSNTLYNKPWEPKIVALSDEQLSDPRIIQSLAITCWCIQYGTKHMSRRSLPNIAADIWRDFKGQAFNANGTSYVLGDVDYMLGGEVDLDFTWLRDFFAYALNPPTHQLRDNMKARIRFIDLTIKAGGPALWRKVGRNCWIQS